MNCIQSKPLFINLLCFVYYSREVLQLRSEIRDSCEVRSALEFVNTLNSRNYVRFFKLARSNRDYLQCCLLQRYFNQMRNQAFQIMVQAYGPPKKGQVCLLCLSHSYFWDVTAVI